MSDSHRSHLSSLTMRLKDKLHSPKVKSPAERIKRTQSQRPVSACIQPDVSSTQTHSKAPCVLADQERSVLSALRYFKTLLDKLVVLDRRRGPAGDPQRGGGGGGCAVDQRAVPDPQRGGGGGCCVDQQVLVELLCGAAGQVLEAVQNLVQAERRIQKSKTVSSSCLSDLYGAVAQLIRWTDQLTLRHEDKGSIATVTMAIQTLQDAVKELVRLANETPRGCAPPSPSPSLSDATSEFPANEGTGQSRQDLTYGPPTEEVSAPPKPPKPLPLLNVQMDDKPLPLLNMQIVDDKPLPLLNVQVDDKPLPLLNMQMGDKPLPLLNMEMDDKPLPLLKTQTDKPLPLLNMQVADKPLPLLNMQSDKPLPLLNMQTDKPLPLLNMQMGDKPLPLVNMRTDKPLPLLNSVPALPPKKRHSLKGSAPCRVAVVAPMRRIEETECLKNTSGDTLYSEPQDKDFLRKDFSSDEMDLPPPHPPPPPPTSSPPPSPPTSLHSSPPPPALPQKRRSVQGIVIPQATPPAGDDPAPLHRSPSQHEHVPPVFDDDHLHGNPVSSPLSPSGSPPPLPEKKHHIHQYLQFMSMGSSASDSVSDFYQRSQSSHKYNTPRDLSVYQLTNLNLPHVPCLPPKKRQLDSTAEDGEDITKQSSHPDQRGREAHKEQHANDDDDDDEGVLLMDQQDVLDRLTLKTEEEEGPDVKAGSPDILLVRATEIDSNDQRLYCEAFLYTYRSFISPYDVISKLQHRYRHLCKGIEPVNLRASKNTFLLLVRVVDEICAVELDGDLQVLLMELVFSLVIGGELALACLLRTNFLSKLVQRKKLIGAPLSLRPLSAMGVAARPGTLHDFRSQDVAEQLTLLDSELFYKIELPEALLWSKEQNEEKCPNLTEFTQHFNNVSFWVRSVVILQERPQDRERLLLKFIKVMKHLRKLNNFNSYLCVLSALDSAPLSRLDWQRNTAEALEEYSSLIDSSSSFRNYRAALADVEPPCIPYLGLILQDLTFVHLGNPDQVMTSQGSKVNFSKRWQQFNILDTVRSFQQIRYSVTRNEDIVSFFNGFSDHLAEEALWELSLRIRPRNTPRANQR